MQDDELGKDTYAVLARCKKASAIPTCQYVFSCPFFRFCHFFPDCIYPLCFLRFSCRPCRAHYPVFSDCPFDHYMSVGGGADAEKKWGVVHEYISLLLEMDFQALFGAVVEGRGRDAWNSRQIA